MIRRLCGFLLALLPFLAYAQASPAEPPVEHASMFAVVIFVVLFAGSCLAYFVYLWWDHRKAKPPRDE